MWIRFLSGFVRNNCPLIYNFKLFGEALRNCIRCQGEGSFVGRQQCKFYVNAIGCVNAAGDGNPATLLLCIADKSDIRFF